MSRLVMTLLIRDEEDIIETNIRFHAKQGIDSFIVMDNGSIDSTVDKVRELQKEFEIQLFHQPVHDYQQRQWMTRLAHEAKSRMGTRWVISNDADEFWMPSKNQNQQSCWGIKKRLRRFDSVATIKRVNCLLDNKTMQSNEFIQAPYYVTKTIKYSREQELYDDEISIALADISPKVIVNPSGLIKIAGGNHRATHWLSPLTARNENRLIVRHYPFRSWNQFKSNVERRVSLIEKHPQARMGEHYRRWARQYKSGILEAEFEKLYVNSSNQQEWQAKGNIALFDSNETLSKLIES